MEFVCLFVVQLAIQKLKRASRFADRVEFFCVFGTEIHISLQALFICLH
jgi:hypothetical protein